MSWFDLNWQNRRKVTIDATKVSGSGSHTDFPVLVSEANFDRTDFFSKIKSDGSDIVFTQSNGTTKLKREVILVDTVEKKMEAWVKIPSLSTNTDTIIYIYYDNPSANEPNDTTTWNNDFAAVYHMNNDPNTSKIQDSTSNNADGTKGTSGEPSEVDGPFGKAQSFDGVDDKIDITGMENAIDTLTITALIFPITAGEGNLGRIISKTTGLSSDDEWDFMVGSSKKLEFKQLRWDTTNGHWKTGTNIYNFSDWSYVSVTYNSGSTTNDPEFRVNGVVKNETETTAPSGSLGPGTSDTEIGNLGTGRTFDGKIAEIRVSHVIRPGDWIITEYNGMNDPGAFYSVGAEENAPELILQGDQIIFKTGSVPRLERMRITNIGNVGIGATDPTTNFQVNQSTTGPGTVTTNFTDTLEGLGTQFTNTFNIGDKITVSGETVRIVNEIIDDETLIVIPAFSTLGSGLTYTLSGGTRFTVKGNGNVGIGTDNPVARLHVAEGPTVSTVQQVGTIGYFTRTSATQSNLAAQVSIIAGTQGAARLGLGNLNDENAGVIFYDNATNSIKFFTNGNNITRLEIKSDGVVEIAGKIQAQEYLGLPSQDIMIQAPATQKITLETQVSGDILLKPAGDAKIILTNSQFIIQKNGTPTPTDLMTIDINGNVGIGTSSPQQGLSVFNGNMEVLDPTILANESLKEPDFFTNLKWSTTGDFDDTFTGGDATYAHNSGSGKLIQTKANLAITPLAPNSMYKFDFEVKNVTVLGAITAKITGFPGIAFTDQSLNLNAGVHTIFFRTNGNPGDFEISATSTQNGDTFTLDNFLLKEVIGGNVIVSGLLLGSDFVGSGQGIKITPDGNVGIGEIAPASKLEVLDTSAQLRLSFSDGIDTTFGVDDSGNLTITSSGSKVTIADELDINTHKITNVVDPTAAQDAATKNYVDNVSNSNIFGDMREFKADIDFSEGDNDRIITSVNLGDGFIVTKTDTVNVSTAVGNWVQVVKGIFSSIDVSFSMKANQQFAKGGVVLSILKNFDTILSTTTFTVSVNDTYQTKSKNQSLSSVASTDIVSVMLTLKQIGLGTDFSVDILTKNLKVTMNV